MQVRDRVVALHRIPARDLIPNPLNWHVHPPDQREALRAVPAEVGLAGVGIVRRRDDGAFELLDGHLRQEELDQNQAMPVIEVDLTPDESLKVLMTHDALGAMAAADRSRLEILSTMVSFDQDALTNMVRDLVNFEPPPAGEQDPLRMTKAGALGKLSERFMIPPFSVLDARQGYWQERKRAWIALGIRSELGRGDVMTWSHPRNVMDPVSAKIEGMRKASPGGSPRPATRLGPDGKTVRGDGHGRPMAYVGRPDATDPVSVASLAISGGTSIFDPVLCEVVYRWFCPPGGRVLDPFAGGSVRGIVAGWLGRDYYGIDLSAPQIAANEAQAQQVLGAATDRATWRISAKSLAHRLNCTQEGIRDGCHGACCRTRGGPNGYWPPRAQPQDDGASCHYLTPTGCRLAEQDKPVTCLLYPLVLNDHGTVVRHFRSAAGVCKPCVDQGPPMYQALRGNLTTLFGQDQADRICEQVAAGQDPQVDVPPDVLAAYRAERQEEQQNLLPPPRSQRTPDQMPDLTPVERHGDLLVKRDDLYRIAGSAGGKVRTCWALAQGAVGLVTAGSRQSPQVNIVAGIAARLGLPCRVHVPAGEQTPELAAAERAGAEVVRHRPGHNSVIVARARQDAADRGWTEIPFGMECQAAVDLTASQVANIPDDVQRIVVAVGSGMSLAGILAGLDRRGLQIPVLGVQVGADPTKRLDRYAPGWRDRVELVPSGLDYHDPAPDQALGDLALDPIYEAKTLRFLRPGDLLWVVGIRQTAGAEPEQDQDRGRPVWVVGDARDLDALAGGQMFDLLFTCPPYFDLELYSTSPQDLSRCPDLAAYRDALTGILRSAAGRLRQDRFAVLVMGEARGRDGNQYGLVPLAVEAATRAGLSYYNEAILVTAVGTLPLRAARGFEVSRKLGRTHQTVLVFVKGDGRAAADVCGQVDVDLSLVEMSAPVGTTHAGD